MRDRLKETIRQVFAIFAFAASVCALAVPAAVGAEGPTGTPAKDKLPAQAIKDALRLTNPAGVRMDGTLGYRVWIDRLAVGSKLFHTYTINVFSNRAKNEKYTDWGGEYPGKILQGAAWVWRYGAEFPDVVAKLDGAAPFQIRNFAYTFDSKAAAFQAKVEQFALKLMAAQEPDGYLGCYPPEQRWKVWDVWSHKYNMLGLLAYHQATGDKAALEACRKMGLCLAEAFGEGRKDITLFTPDKEKGLASSSVLEPLALTYEYTGEQKILELCQYLVKRQEENPKVRLLSRKDVDGKAYEALSNTTGLCELYRATGDKRYLDAARTQWQFIRDHHRYCHGAITGNNEHLGKADSLGLKGTCEGCITVTWLHLNGQLLRLTGEPAFADEIHRLAYNFMGQAQNCFNGGWDHCGLWSTSFGDYSCCGASGWRAPPLLPMLAILGGQDNASVNLYETGVYNVSLGDGTSVKIDQKTEYPWNGDVEIAVSPSESTEFDLRLLIPFFFKSGSIQVNGQDVKVDMAAGKYASVKRTWSAGDKLALHFDMPIETEQSNAYPGMFSIRLGPQYLGTHPNLPPVGDLNSGWKAPAFELVKPPFPKWEGDKDARPNTWRGWEGDRLVRALIKTAPDMPAKGYMLAPVSEVGGVQYLSKDGGKTPMMVWRKDE